LDILPPHEMFPDPNRGKERKSKPKVYLPPHIIKEGGTCPFLSKFDPRCPTPPPPHQKKKVFGEQKTPTPTPKTHQTPPNNPPPPPPPPPPVFNFIICLMEVKWQYSCCRTSFDLNASLTEEYHGSLSGGYPFSSLPRISLI